MPAAKPESEYVTVMVLLVPIFALSNKAPASRVTLATSAARTPVRVPGTTAATGVPSYTRGVVIVGLEAVKSLPVISPVLII